MWHSNEAKKHGWEQFIYFQWYLKLEILARLDALYSSFMFKTKKGNDLAFLMEQFMYYFNDNVSQKLTIAVLPRE